MFLRTEPFQERIKRVSAGFCEGTVTYPPPHPIAREANVRRLLDMQIFNQESVRRLLDVQIFNQESVRSY